MANAYYLRDGSRTDAETWRSLQADPGYVQVRKTTLSNGRWISTIWLGIDQGGAVSRDAPLFFESVVFDDATRRPLASVRHVSEADACEAHRKLIEEWA